MILPTKADLDLQAQYAAEMEEQLIGALVDELAYWTGELRSVLGTDDIEMMWVPENATHPALVPGRYHIVERKPPPTPPNVIPVTQGLYKGEINDEFIAPGSWLFDALNRNNHWSDRSMKEQARIKNKAAEARERAIQREKEEIAWEIDEKVDYLLNPKVSFAQTGRAWTNKAHARRSR